jgi:hypothetical protein
MKSTRLLLTLMVFLAVSLFLFGCGKGSQTPDNPDFQFSCIPPSGDACENHYGSADQGCASVDEQSPDKCPESYQGNQAVGVCAVQMGDEMYLEWVPYSVPPAVDPVSECENILNGVWSDTYIP